MVTNEVVVVIVLVGFTVKVIAPSQLSLAGIIKVVNLVVFELHPTAGPAELLGTTYQNNKPCLAVMQSM